MSRSREESWNARFTPALIEHKGHQGHKAKSLNVKRVAELQLATTEDTGDTEAVYLSLGLNLLSSVSSVVERLRRWSLGKPLRCFSFCSFFPSCLLSATALL